MEDLAPVEPWARAARAWAVACGALFVVLGVLPAFMGAPALSGWAQVACGLTAVIVGAMPLSYSLRATALFLLGGAVGTLGMAGSGPAGVLSQSVGFSAILHLVTAVGLPAALLFRARYRAYEGARYILVSALAATLPFVGYCVVGIGAGEVAVQVTSAIALLAIAASLLGFMGSDTTIAGHWVAAFVILTVSGQIASETLLSNYRGSFDSAAVLGLGQSSAFAAAAVLGSLGLFQLLARRHWDEARSVDFRRATTDKPSIPPLTDSWQTRD